MGQLFRKPLSILLPMATLVTAQDAYATDYTPIILAGLLGLGLVTVFFAGVLTLFGIGATSSFGLAILIMGVTLFGFWLYPQIKDSLMSPTESPSRDRGAMLDTNEPIT